jgi:hypothetical protein
MAKATIKLKSYVDIQKEANAASTIAPGMLIEYTSAGKFQPHSSAGQNAVALFAIEDALQGNGIDDTYSSGDPVRGWFPQRGEEVFAILKDGENITKGDMLESGGSGYLQKHTEDVDASAAGATTIYSHQIVGIALESVDLSGSSAAESSGGLGYPYNRIKVLIV